MDIDDASIDKLIDAVVLLNFFIDGQAKLVNWIVFWINLIKDSVNSLPTRPNDLKNIRNKEVDNDISKKIQALILKDANDVKFMKIRKRIKMLEDSIAKVHNNIKMIVSVSRVTI